VNRLSPPVGWFDVGSDVRVGLLAADELVPLLDAEITATPP
jgi:hypothetical protein